MKMPPEVSIILPSYNHQRFIEQAVSSVLRQSLEDLELIVIDDGSPDASNAVVESLAADDARVRLLVRSNRGAPASINEGIGLARGRWIGILNSDDYYHENRLERVLRTLKASNAGWGYSRVDYIDDAGRPLSSPEKNHLRAIQATIARWPTVGFSLLKNNTAITSGNLFFERRLFELTGPLRDLDYVHDWDFALRLLQYAEPVFVDEELYFYRLHGTNTYRSIPPGTTVRETDFIMRDFLLRIHAARPLNERAPSPYTWPGFFEEMMERMSYERYMPSRQELAFILEARRYDERHLPAAEPYGAA